MTEKAEKDTGEQKEPATHAEANSNPGKLSLKTLAERQERMAEAIDDTVTELKTEFTTSIAELQEAQRQFFESLSGMSPRDHPSGAREYNKPDPRDHLPSDEIVPDELHVPQRTDVDSPAFKSKEEEMAFMEELVTIFILPPSGDQADPIFTVYVNRLCVTLERGKTYTLPRKFVETLARGKPLGYTQERANEVSGRHGHDLWVNRRSTELRYPFQVQKDTPRGRAWLAGVLAQP